MLLLGISYSTNDDLNGFSYLTLRPKFGSFLARATRMMKDVFPLSTLESNIRKLSVEISSLKKGLIYNLVDVSMRV